VLDYGLLQLAKGVDQVMIVYHEAELCCLMVCSSLLKMLIRL